MRADRVVAVHQPNYLPYLGFFQKMAQADVFVLYDTASFSKNGLTNRNRVKAATGAQWLTVPVRKPAGRAIKDVEIASAIWATKHSRTLRANYQPAPYFASYFPELDSILQAGWTRLSDLNVALIRCISKWLSIDTRLVLASALPSSSSNNATEKLVHLTAACGGSVYLSGAGGRDYLQEAMFQNVALRYCKFVARPYPQLHGPFVPNLSTVDCVFNCGEMARELL